MKGYLALLNLLLLSYAASAQLPDSATGRRRLDREKELLTIKFGTLYNHFNEQKDREKWNRHPERHKLGPYQLEYPHYHFSDDRKKSRLFLVYIRTYDSTATPDKVLQLLRALYGPPNHSHEKYWRGKRVSLYYAPEYIRPGEFSFSRIILQSTIVPQSRNPHKER